MQLSAKSVVHLEDGVRRAEDDGIPEHDVVLRRRPTHTRGRVLHGQSSAHIIIYLSIMISAPEAV